MNDTLILSSPAGAAAVVRLRTATPADAPALRALHHAAFAALAPGHYPASAVLSFLRHFRTLDDALLDEGTYTAAECNGRIVACGGWTSRTPDYADTLSGSASAAAAVARRAFVRAMYTDPAWVRRGLGRAVLARIAAAARRDGATLLELDATLPGVPLYRAVGFTALARRFVTLPDGERLAVVQMRRALIEAPRRAGATAPPELVR